MIKVIISPWDKQILENIEALKSGRVDDLTLPLRILRREKPELFREAVYVFGFEGRKKYMKAYRKRPEVKAHKKEYDKKYTQRPEIKSHRKAYYQEYYKKKKKAQEKQNEQLS